MKHGYLPWGEPYHEEASPVFSTCHQCSPSASQYSSLGSPLPAKYPLPCQLGSHLGSTRQKSSDKLNKTVRLLSPPCKKAIIVARSAEQSWFQEIHQAPDSSPIQSMRPLFPSSREVTAALAISRVPWAAGGVARTKIPSSPRCSTLSIYVSLATTNNKRTLEIIF